MRLCKTVNFPILVAISQKFKTLVTPDLIWPGSQEDCLDVVANALLSYVESQMRCEPTMKAKEVGETPGNTGVYEIRGFVLLRCCMHTKTDERPISIETETSHYKIVR